MNRSTQSATVLIMIYRYVAFSAATAVVFGFISWNGGGHHSTEAAPEQTAPKDRNGPKPKPLRAPDYTKLSRALDDAHLPREEPEVLWKYVSESVTRARTPTKPANAR